MKTNKYFITINLFNLGITIPTWSNAIIVIDCAKQCEILTNYVTTISTEVNGIHKLILIIQGNENEKHK